MLALFAYRAVPVTGKFTGSRILRAPGHDHVLEQRATPGSPLWGCELCGGVVLALTGIHWREAWKYGLHAYRYSQ